MYTPQVKNKLLFAAASASRITMEMFCPPVIVWPASSGCEMNCARMMSAWVEIAVEQLRVVIVEESFVVPAANLAN